MRRVAILALLAFGLAALAALSLPFLISPDFLRQRIADRLATATGRTVTVGGDPNLSIYPHLAVSVGAVTIANLGFGDADPFIAADGVTARVRALPLLAGRLEFDAFELTHPRIHLIKDANGHGNWLTARADTDDAHSVSKFALGRVQITNGTVVYDNLATKTHEEMTALDLELNWPQATSPLSSSGKFQWRGQSVEFNGTVVSPVDLANGKESPARFALGSTPLRASFNGRVSGLDELRLIGDASVSSPALRRAIQWTGTEMGNGAILGPASIEGKVDWSAGTIAFSEAKLSLDGNDAQGAVTIAYGNGHRPGAQGTLAASKLDFSPYLETMTADLSANGPWPFAPTSLAIADVLNLDLRLSADEVLFGSLDLRNVGATATIKDGAMSVNVGRAQAYGGTVNARVSAMMAGDVLVGRVQADLSAMRAELPLRDLLSVPALSGEAQSSLEISASGGTWGDFFRSARGTASLDVANGALTGVDMEAIGARALDPLAQPMPAGEGATSFDTLSATLAIENSNLGTDDLLIKGKGFTLSLAGKGSLITGSVEAKAKLAMGSADSAPIPLAVTGTWRAPLIGPDQPATLRKGDKAGAAQPRG